MKGSGPETEGADHTEHEEEGRADRISGAGSENILTSLLSPEREESLSPATPRLR